MDKPGTAPATVEELVDWLVARVGEYLPELAEPVSPDRELGEYGLDSIVVLAFAADVEERLAIPIDPTVVWDHPTIEQLATFLVAETEGRHETA
ncbi:acyl carrier protein [Streptomyces viridifaciens]|nr:peptide carrier protein [Streptomyces viridifaciens]UKZ05361.1 acyl carrier protein [Streptomyces viridifaciens]